MSIPVDIRENYIREQYPEEMKILLMDRTTGKNIFWATHSYESLKKGFLYDDQITLEHITGKYGDIIQPRALKSREEQVSRVKNMAEVFTPSWVCNAQNNLIDNAWFERESVFNEEYIDKDGIHCWKVTEEKIQFPARSGKKSWKGYVRDIRLEITCGEGPYMVSRYDTVSGEFLPIEQRVGFLDRKLRVVGENTKSSDDWLEMAKDAIKATYGYEWQGDSLLLARESVFASFIEYYEAKFNEAPLERELREVAEIISWNIWQMDGLKLVVPDTCDNKYTQTLFGEQKMICEACEKSALTGHIGDQCMIKDWFEKGGPVTLAFQQLVSLR